MTTEQDKPKYYFCFRVINPIGSWVVEGPYDTMDRAMAERNNAKAWDAQVTVPFIASSKEDALRRCELF